MPSCHVDCLIIPPQQVRCNSFNCQCLAGYVQCAAFTCCMRYPVRISVWENPNNMYFPSRIWLQEWNPTWWQSHLKKRWDGGKSVVPKLNIFRQTLARRGNKIMRSAIEECIRLIEWGLERGNTVGNIKGTSSRINCFQTLRMWHHHQLLDLLIGQNIEWSQRKNQKLQYSQQLQCHAPRPHLRQQVQLH